MHTQCHSAYNTVKLIQIVIIVLQLSLSKKKYFLVAKFMSAAVHMGLCTKMCIPRLVNHLQ